MFPHPLLFSSLYVFLFGSEGQRCPHQPALFKHQCSGQRELRTPPGSQACSAAAEAGPTTGTQGRRSPTSWDRIPSFSILRAGCAGSCPTPCRDCRGQPGLAQLTLLKGVHSERQLYPLGFIASLCGGAGTTETYRSQQRGGRPGSGGESNGLHSICLSSYLTIKKHLENPIPFPNLPQVTFRY